MNDSRARVLALMAAADSVEARNPSRAGILQWAYGMSDAICLTDLLRDVARRRAMRRGMAEGRYRPADFDAPGFQLDDELIVIESDAFASHYHNTGEIWSAIEAWCEEPERLGWPIVSEYDPRGYVGFRDHLRRCHEFRDDWRGSDLSAAWRAQHPEWRPDMTEAEHDAWEVGRLLDCGRRD